MEWSYNNNNNKHIKNHWYPVFSFSSLLYSIFFIFLISGLLLRTKTNIRRLDLQPPDTELQTVRIRTCKDTELIISSVGEYFMLVIQQCEGRNKPQAEEGKAEEVKEA